MMYTAFFGFRENPFNLTPDPKYLYLSRYHREALDHLLYGINERRGFIAITGGVGTGKTTLCRALLERLDPNTKSALIFSSFISDMEILKTINQEFGIRMGPGEKTKKDYIDALNEFLLDNFQRGGNALLLIDEAQNLSHAVLEQIRMLSNLETEKEKLIQVALVGQSELKGVLSSPSLRQLNERITVRYDLRPVDGADLRRYVGHRLAVAGGGGVPNFTKGAFKEIYAYSRGNPRRINAVCDRALLIAYAREKQTITGDMVKEAVRDLSGDGGYGRIRDRQRPPGVGPLTLVLLLLLAVAAGLAAWSFRRNAVPPSEAVTEPAPNRPGPNKIEGLFLDERASVTGLFDLFRAYGHARAGRRHGLDGSPDPGVDHPDLSLISLNLPPEYGVLLKKPFRVVATNPVSPSGPEPAYLLVTRMTDRGAVLMDREGNLRPVKRGFILRHWGMAVSFLYPHEGGAPRLAKGMASPEVLRVQALLNRLGYSVVEDGIFEEQTFRGVLRFQKDFGLDADGIIGPRTMALMYQMTE